MTTTDIINGLLEREGGEVTNDPLDRGGITRWGITLPVLAEWRGGHATPAMIEALTREEAGEIYEHLYLVRPGYLGLTDERVRVLVCDWAVNSGIGTATRALQRLLGVTVDGMCGPETLAATNRYDGRTLLKLLGHARQAFYVNIVVRDPEQIRFLHGWLNRNWAVSVDPL